MTRKVSIFRMDHREFRDQRITTHLALTSRALGAREFYYTGDKDPNLEDSVNDVSSRWGGDFDVEYVERASAFIRNWKGIIVHLTMYGEPFENTLKTLETVPEEDLLIVAGGPKVPRFVYEHADFNTSIGWQPHSEVTAVGILLYKMFGEQYLYHEYSDAKMKIQPNSFKARRSERFADHLS